MAGPPSVPGQGVSVPPSSFSPRQEIGLRRAASEAQHQAVAGQRMQRLDAVRQLDRMAHRHLQHAGADLDPLCHRGDDAHRDDRIQCRASAPERIGDPKPVKALFLDRPRQPGDPVERLPLHLRRPTQNIDDMHSHRPGSPSAAPLIAGGTLAEPIATVASRERHPAMPSPRVQPSNFPLDKTGF